MAKKKPVTKPKDKKKKTPKKNGRPYAITKEKAEKIIELLADGMSQAKVASYVGVCEDTIIEHKKKFSEFAERIEKAKEETTRLAHKSVKVGMLKDWKAGAWWLERTEPERFREKKEIEVTKPSLIEGMFSDDYDDKDNGK